MASNETELEGSKALFSPPLYLQRYGAVIDKLTEYANELHISKVLDIGCAECCFLRQLKHSHFVTKAIGLDIDLDLIKNTSRSLQPLAADYLQKRQHDLEYKVLAGSIADFDDCIADVDAVTGIEVIEHLHEPVLCAMVKTVFDNIQPKLVVLTTPNIEYNVVFPGYEVATFRHWDHKFEWTREEFETWSKDVASRYGYSVQFGGCGEPPASHAYVGFCSQMAVFIRLQSTKDQNTTPYKYNDVSCPRHTQVFSAIIPGSNMSQEEELKFEIQYTVNKLLLRAKEEVSDDGMYDDKHSVSLEEIIRSSLHLQKSDIHASQLREILVGLGYELINDGCSILLDLDDTDEPLSSRGSSLGEIDEDYLPATSHNHQDEECWD